MGHFSKLIPHHIWKFGNDTSLNPVTLCFPKELEKKFNDDNYRSSIIFLRISFIMGILFFSLFSILDYQIAANHTGPINLIRYCYVNPIILFVFLLSFLPQFKQIWQGAIFFALLVSGSGIVLMLINSPRIIERGYYVGLILVLIYGYFLIKLRFIYATICGTLLVVLYLLVDHYILNLPNDKSFSNAFFLITNNLALILGSYFMEYYTRRDFYHRFKLKQEQETVRKINLNLETTIHERTKIIDEMNSKLRTKIKELHASQKELKNSEEKLRLAFSASNACVWDINLVNDKIDFTEIGVKILNYTQAQVKGINFMDLIDSEDKEIFQKSIDSICNQTSYMFDLDFKVHAFADEWKWLHLWGKVSEYDQSGKPVLITGTAIDATLRKENEIELYKYRQNLEKSVQDRTKNLESSQKALVCLMEDMNLASEELSRVNQQLKSVNEELESFSYSVSHDLKSPLRAIDGFSNALMEDYSAKLDSVGNEYLQLIHKNAIKMNQLITDLLAFSRLGRKMIKPEEIDISPFIQEVYDSLIIDHPKRDIQLHIADLPVIKADKALLRQVFVNLLSNAIKFTATRQKSQISLGLIEDSDNCVIFVKDNGVGFDMNYSDKLFGVFQRLHSDDEFPGYGVGLSLVKRIITKHNGRVWAESEKDKGATFFVSLPKQKINKKKSQGKNETL